MTKYGLHGMLRAQEGQGAHLVAILLEAAELVSTAQGCQIYLVSKDTADQDAIWVTEVWDSKDHDNSLMVEGVRALIGRALPLLADNPQQGTELDVMGGKGLS